MRAWVVSDRGNDRPGEVKNLFTLLLIGYIDTLGEMCMVLCGVGDLPSAHDASVSVSVYVFDRV